VALCKYYQFTFVSPVYLSLSPSRYTGREERKRTVSNILRVTEVSVLDRAPALVSRLLLDDCYHLIFVGVVLLSVNGSPKGRCLQNVADFIYIHV